MDEMDQYVTFRNGLETRCTETYYHIRHILCRDDLDALKEYSRLDEMDMSAKDGYTILHYAIDFESKKCVEYIIATYPHLLYAKTMLGHIPLTVGMMVGMDLTDYYPDIGQLIQWFRTNLQETLFHEAAKYGAASNMRKMLQIDDRCMDLPDDKGRTPLYIAIESMGSWDIIRMLLEAGADPFRENESVVSPYAFAKAQLEDNSIADAEYKETLRKTVEWMESSTLVMKEPSF